MWIIQRNTKSDEESDSILEMEKRFRSGGIGKSKMIHWHLYQNRWVSVNHNRSFQRAVFYCIKDLEKYLIFTDFNRIFSLDEMSYILPVYENPKLFIYVRVILKILVMSNVQIDSSYQLSKLFCGMFEKNQSFLDRQISTNK